MKNAESQSVSSVFNVGEKSKSLQPSGLCGVPFHKLQAEAEQEIERVIYFFQDAEYVFKYY